MAREVAVLIGTGSIGVAIGRRAAIGRKLLLADYNETDHGAMSPTQLHGEGYEVTTQQIDIADHDSVAALADAAAALGDVTRVITPPASHPSRPAPSGSCRSTSPAPPTSWKSSAGSSPPAAPASWSPAWPGTWATGYPEGGRAGARLHPGRRAARAWTSWPPRRSGTPAPPTPWPSGPTPCGCALPRSPGVSAAPG